MEHKVIKILGLMIMLAVCLQAASADLGTFKQGKCLNLLGSDNVNSMNLTSVTYPNGTTLFINTPMTNNNGVFNYTFCSTLQRGSYVYSYVETDGTPWTNGFVIGEDISLAYVAVWALVFLLIYGLMIYKKKVPLYKFIGKTLIMINGIAGFVISYNIIVQIVMWVTIVYWITGSFAFWKEMDND